MIFFFENGRLGNQLFQYCGIKMSFPSDKIIFFGCEGLKELFDNVDVDFIEKESISRWIPFGFLQRIIYVLADLRIIGLITQEPDATSFKLSVRKGLLSKILVSKDVFFQHRDISDNINEPPILKPDLLETAARWLERKGAISNQHNLVFVHIRRGDYLHWPSDEYPAVLDLVWYLEAINVIRSKISDPVFVFMSDDQYYLYDFIEESERFLISDNAPEVDLAIMSLCTGGILSASSFAWWGAWFSRNSVQGNLVSIYLAPKFWAGHRRKEWHPQGFETKWIQYLE